MHTRHLRYLRLVLREGSFTAAARAAGVTQPAITQAMRALAEELGTALFERDGRRVRPTPAALRLARHGAAFDDAIRGLGAARPTPRQAASLRVGIASGAALLCGPLIASAWHAAERRGPVRLTGGGAPDLIAALRRDELDLVVAPRPRGHSGSGLEEVRLYSSAPSIYAREGHALQGARSLAELRDVGWIVVGPTQTPGDMIEEAHRVRRLDAPKVLVQCSDYATLLRLVAESDAMGVVPHAVLVGDPPREPVRSLRLREGLPRYDVCLFRSTASRGRDAGVDAVAQSLADRAGRHERGA